MYKLPIAILILSAAAIRLGAQTPTEPPDLISLRDSWQRARTSTVAPLDKKYEDALLAMKDRYTKQGNLQVALAVDAAITKLRTGGATSAKEPPAVPAPPAISGITKMAVKTKRDLEKFLTGTTWNVTSNGKPWAIAEFKERGKLIFQKEREWSTTDARVVLMQGMRATISDDLTRFEVTWGESGPLVGTLTKKEEQ